MKQKYLSPASLTEALIAHASADLRVVSGGTDCYADPSMVPAAHGWLDISRIESLRGISLKGEWVRLGAATSWSEIAACADGLVPTSLRQAARVVGSRQIQARGTIGGNICNASPAADGLPPLLSLDSRVELASVAGFREMSLAKFLLGRRQTALGAHELLTCVKFRRVAERDDTAFYKFGNRRGMTIAVVSAAIFLRWSSTQRVEEARVIIGSASELPVRAAALETRLVGARKADLAHLIAQAPIEEISPVDDLRASAQFRRQLVGIVTSRACLQIEKGLEDVDHIV